MAFTNLLERQRAHGTAVFIFDTIFLGGADHPALTVRFAGQSTPGYRAALIKAVNTRGHRSDKLTDQRIREDHAVDAHLFAQHCVVNWEHVYEDNGKPAPCTPEKVEELLLALIATREDLFLGFRNFVRNPENFVDERGAAPSASGAELGKS